MQWKAPVKCATSRTSHSVQTARVRVDGKKSPAPQKQGRRRDRRLSCPPDVILSWDMGRTRSGETGTSSPETEKRREREKKKR